MKNRVRGLFYFFAAAAVALLAVSSVAAAPKGPATEPLDDFELGKYQYCGTDRDCVVATNGCCDCANGGDDVAVNKERLEAFRARFDCLHTACTERAAIPPCGSGVVSCVSHRCQYMNRSDATFAE